MGLISATVSVLTGLNNHPNQSIHCKLFRSLYEFLHQLDEENNS